MNYEQVLEYMNQRDMTMSRYERVDWDLFVRKMKVSLDVPFIHITGSNGKGSTAKYIYEIYRAAGYKVALFSKPYLKKPNEMISINGELIKDEDFARVFSKKEREYTKFDLSSFEIQTYIAFEYFNEQKPDIAIIECGMGGETDSTNLADGRPVLSIITTVSLEHTAFLGRSRSEIARNKAGIVKYRCPVLMGYTDEQIQDVVREIAEKKESLFYKVDDFHNVKLEGDYVFDYHPYSELKLSNKATYQLRNASLAIEAVRLLNDRFPITEEHIRKGLLSELLPCRLEKHGNIIIDGAHNPEAVNEMMNSIVNLSGNKAIHVVFASLRDKNIAVELPRIARDVADITLTTFENKRARDEMDYFLYAGDHTYNEDYKEVVKNLMSEHPEDIILITGSLAFAAIAREFVIEELGL